MSVLLRFIVMPAIALAGLVGCSGSGNLELQQWMDEKRRTTTPKVTPLSPPKRYVPLAYTQSGSVDPFNADRLTQALRRDSTSAGAAASLVSPELNRRKEPLESYPLDVMAMVGSLDRAGAKVALVKVDNLLYQVRTGAYLGQNFGKVTKISENEVTLREIVQDAAGEWIERVATLQLQENTK